MRRRWAVGLGSLLVGAAVLAATAGMVIGRLPGPQPAQAQPGEDPALLHDLAERLLSRGPRGILRARLFAGALPPDLTFEVPLLPGSRLIGSAVVPLSEENGPIATGEGLTVILDTEASEGAVLAFYQDALLARGWTIAEPYRDVGGGGFRPAYLPGGTLFCQGAYGPWLAVFVYERAGEPNEVRLQGGTGYPNLCGGPPPEGPPPPPPGAPPSPSPPPDILPRITLPRGVELVGVLGEATLGGPGTRAANATAITAMSAAELEAHIAAQLAAAGWTWLAGRVDGPLAWSLWRLPGEDERHGLLTVWEGLPGQDRRVLRLVIAFTEPVTPLGPGPAGAPLPGPR